MLSRAEARSQQNDDDHHDGEHHQHGQQLRPLIAPPGGCGRLAATTPTLVVAVQDGRIA